MPPSREIKVTFTLHAPRSFDPDAFLAAHPEIKPTRVQYVDASGLGLEDLPVAINVFVGMAHTMEEAAGLGAAWLEKHRAALREAARAGAEPTILLPFPKDDTDTLLQVMDEHFFGERWADIELRVGYTFPVDDDVPDDEDDEFISELFGQTPRRERN